MAMRACRKTLNTYKKLLQLLNGTLKIKLGRTRHRSHSDVKFHAPLLRSIPPFQVINLASGPEDGSLEYLTMGPLLNSHPGSKGSSIRARCGATSQTHETSFTSARNSRSLFLA